jgi:hypothetical protein
VLLEASIFIGIMNQGKLLFQETLAADIALLDNHIQLAPQSGVTIPLTKY